MRVERWCHICQTPIRGDVAYARRVDEEGTGKRIYAHPACFFDEVPEADRPAYRRELLSGEEESRAHQASWQEQTDRRGGEARPPHPPSNLAARSASSPRAVIQVDGLEETYLDGTRAMKGVDFQVRRGEVFGVLGPNGAGKTTLIGMLGTLVRPTGGQATVASAIIGVGITALNFRTVHD